MEPNVWHYLEISTYQGQVQVWVDGEMVTDVIDDVPLPPGAFGLGAPPSGIITYDAIYFGGGASGRFGAAFLQALGGKVLIVEREGLGGECHKCRCAFENFLADQASMAEILRTCSGLSWYPEVDASKFEHHKACQVYREIGQRAFHDAMTHQTEIQLEIPVAWGEGKVIDKNTVEVDGKAIISMSGERPNNLSKSNKPDKKPH